MIYLFGIAVAIAIAIWLFVAYCMCQVSGRISDKERERGCNEE